MTRSVSQPLWASTSTAGGQAVVSLKLGAARSPVLTAKGRSAGASPPLPPQPLSPALIQRVNRAAARKVRVRMMGPLMCLSSASHHRPFAHPWRKELQPHLHAWLSGENQALMPRSTTDRLR